MSRTATDLKLVAHPDFDPSAGMIEVAPNVVVSIGGPNSPAFSVALTDHQSVVGFPKHGTIGIGFLHGDADLPYSSPQGEIADHIGTYRTEGGDPPDAFSHELVVAAITMIRDAVGSLEQYGVRCAHCIRAHRGPVGHGHWHEACPIGPDPDAYFSKEEARKAALPRDPAGWLIEPDEDDE